MSLLSSSATNLNLTILDRVGLLHLVDKLHNIESIVICSLEGSRYLAHLHRINLCCDIVGECATSSSDTCIGNLRLSLANNLSGSHTALQLLLSLLHGLHQSITVSLRCNHLEINILNVAALNILLELLLLLVILSLQVCIAYLYISILDSGVGNGSQQNVTLLVLSGESHLSRDGVRQQRLSEQALILLSEQLLTERLLNELPIVVDTGVLFHHLGITTLFLLLLIISQELCELANIETTSLLIDKRCLHQHTVGTSLQYILQLLISNGQTNLLGFSLQNGVVDKLLPNLILHLIEFFLREVVAVLSHLNDLLILIDKTLEVLN